jgi:small conductance mechanosensitive channel
MDQQLAYLNQFYVKAIDFLANYSFQIIGALIIVTIGWFLSKYVFNFLIKFFQQHDFDVTLGKFVANGIRTSFPHSTYSYLINIENPYF